MAMISCFECDKFVSDSAISCPNCGFGVAAAVDGERKRREISIQAAAKEKNNFISFSLFLSFVVILFAVWSALEEPQKAKKEIKQIQVQKPSESKSVDIIGVWYDDRPYLFTRYEFFSKGEKIFVKTKYKDGSGEISQLRSKNTSSGRRLEKLDGNGLGEYWVLKPDGTLEIYDNDGFILKYRNGN